MKRWITFLFIFYAVLSAAVAQNKPTRFDVWGQVLDANTHGILSGVKVSLLSQDSVCIGTVTSFDNGITNNNYQIGNVPGSGNYILHLEKKGYTSIYKNVTLKYHKSRRPTVILDAIPMHREMVRKLKEVKVTATLVKMVMKKDTVVFNADAFQLAEGSMLDQLVARLPGVELRGNGQIYVNGRFVSSLLLNGEDFFKGDPSIALQNLPAYTVNQIKVYEKQSDRDKAMGLEKRGEQPLVMDVNLKKQYSVGWMANVDAGGGIEDRYSAKLFGLRFSPRTRLTVYGNLNNITDLSSPDGNGNWNSNVNPVGTIDRHSGGIDLLLQDKEKKIKTTHSLSVVHNKEDIDMNQNSTTFFQSGNVYQRKEWNTQQEKLYVNFSNSFQYIPRYGFYFTVSPYVNYSKEEYDSWTRSADMEANLSERYEGEALDSLFSPTASREYTKNLINKLRSWENEKKSFLSGGADFYLAFRPKKFNRDFLEVSGGYKYMDYDYSNKYRYEMSYWNKGNNTGNERKTKYYMDNYRNSSFNYRATYSLLSSFERHYLNIPFEYSFIYNHRNSERPFYDITDSTLWAHEVDQLSSLRGSLTQYMDWTNSFFSKNETYTHIPKLVVYYAWKDHKNEDKLWVQAELPVNIVQENLDYRRNVVDTAMNRRTAFFNPRLFMIYYPDENNRQYNQLKFDYRYNSWAQNLTYKINYMDTSNPLEVWMTNPNLPDTHSHFVGFDYNWGIPEKQLRVFFYSNYTYRMNSLCQSMTYDAATGIRTYRPETVNGNWYYYGGFNTVAPIDKKRWFYFSNFTDWTYSHNVDYLSLNNQSSIRNIVYKATVKESLRLDFRKDKLFLGLRGNFYWTNAKGKNISTINTFDYSYGLNGNWELPAGFGLSGDLMMYSRRGLETNQLNTDELLCNLHLSKSVLKGKLVFMLDGFDIFNQLSNIRYNINAQGQTETYYNVVQRYAMLRVVYKFNREPKKK